MALNLDIFFKDNTYILIIYPRKKCVLRIIKLYYCFKHPIGTM